MIKKFTEEIDFNITLESLFSTKLCARNVFLKIPAPPETIDFKISASNGDCNFVPKENVIIWKFSKYNGLTEDKLNVLTVRANSTTELSLSQ